MLLALGIALIALALATCHSRLLHTPPPPQHAPLLPNMASPASSTRYVLGRGCDPVRAAFAAKHMGPKLGVQFETATSDAQLSALLATGRKYEAFCIYPGQCQLIKAGQVNGTAMEELVRRHLPDIPILHIEDISQAIPMLQEALSIQPSGDAKPMAPLTQDWPFVD